MITLTIILIALILFIIIIYNSLIYKKNQVNNVFSTVDTLLQKRYDLIPNLVTTVKNYAKHEKQVLEEISELRAKVISPQISNDEKVDIDDKISQRLDKILAIAEDYPELKASENFLHLQSSLCEIEEQISAARRAYNASVTDYNNSIQTVPSNIIANLFGFKAKNLFKFDMQMSGSNWNINNN